MFTQINKIRQILLETEAKGLLNEDQKELLEELKLVEKTQKTGIPLVENPTAHILIIDQSLHHCPACGHKL